MAINNHTIKSILKTTINLKSTIIPWIPNILYFSKIFSQQVFLSCVYQWVICYIIIYLKNTSIREKNNTKYFKYLFIDSKSSVGLMPLWVPMFLSKLCITSLIIVRCLIS